MVELKHRLTIARRLAHVRCSHIPTVRAYHDAVGDVRRWATQLRWWACLARPRRRPLRRVGRVRGADPRLAPRAGAPCARAFVAPTPPTDRLPLRRPKRRRLVAVRPAAQARVRPASLRAQR